MDNTLLHDLDISYSRLFGNNILRAPKDKTYRARFKEDLKRIKEDYLLIEKSYYTPYQSRIIALKHLERLDYFNKSRKSHDDPDVISELHSMRAMISLANEDFEVIIDNNVNTITEVRSKDRLIEMVKLTYPEIYDVFLDDKLDIVSTEQGGFRFKHLKEFFDNVYYNKVFIKRLKIDAFVYNFRVIYLNIGVSHRAIADIEVVSDVLFNGVRPKMQLLRSPYGDDTKHFLCLMF